MLNVTNMLQLTSLVVFPALVILGAMFDIASFTIPNRISMLLIAGFFVAALTMKLPLEAVALNVSAGGVVLLLGMAMFAAGWIGGGDAKLMSSAALWLGWSGAINFLLVTALAGGALAIVLLNLRREPVRLLFATGAPWMERLARPGGAAPYGVAIAIGALAAFPNCLLVQSVG